MEFAAGQKRCLCQFDLIFWPLKLESLALSWLQFKLLVLGLVSDVAGSQPQTSRIAKFVQSSRSARAQAPQPKTMQAKD